MSNLPNWKYAAEVYSIAYRVLERMGAAGHATPAVTRRGEVVSSGHISGDMQALIDALNSGDEEQIKGLLVQDRYLKYR